MLSSCVLAYCRPRVLFSETAVLHVSVKSAPVEAAGVSMVNEMHM